MSLIILGIVFRSLNRLHAFATASCKHSHDLGPSKRVPVEVFQLHQLLNIVTCIHIFTQMNKWNITLASRQRTSKSASKEYCPWARQIDDPSSCTQTRVNARTTSSRMSILYRMSGITFWRSCISGISGWEQRFHQPYRYRMPSGTGIPIYHSLQKSVGKGLTCQRITRLAGSHHDIARCDRTHRAHVFPVSPATSRDWCLLAARQHAVDHNSCEKHAKTGGVRTHRITFP